MSRRLLLLSLAILVLGCMVDAADVQGPAQKRSGPRARAGEGRKGGKGGKGVGRRAARRRASQLPAVTVNPDPMPCRPRNTSVPLPPAPPGKFYLPNCAVVERCSGCCSVESIECVPQPGNSVAKAKWETNEYVLGKNGKWRFNEVVAFEVEQHTKCTCGCKIRSEHCSALQTYDSSSCRCICNNGEESKMCESPRYWDTNSCSCKCPSSSMDCSTGSLMDTETCQCITMDKIVEVLLVSKEAEQPDFYRFRRSPKIL